MRWDAVTARELPSTEVTHLHLLRHGRVDTGGRRLAYGHTDLPLSSEGRAQNEALARLVIRHLPAPDGVVSSDLGRTRALAERIASGLGVPLTLDPALREQHMGAWEGRAWEDLTAADPAGTHAYWNRYLDRAPPDGESFGDLVGRAGAWLDRGMQGALRGGRWVVVTHAGVVRGLVARVLGTPLDEALRWVPAHGSHTHLALAEAGPCVHAFGERPIQLDRGPWQAEQPRIALSGSAGVGKTTLGRTLAQHLELPFLEEGMRRRLESGLDLHRIGFEGLRALVRELWEEQVAAEQTAIRDHAGFVSDRSSVDFAAFWLHYRFTDHEEATRAFLESTLGHAATYDRIVLLPWGVLPYERDGIRASSRWTQRSYQATLEGLLHSEVATPRLALLPPIDGIEQRVAWTLRDLGL